MIYVAVISRRIVVTARHRKDIISIFNQVIEMDLFYILKAKIWILVGFIWTLFFKLFDVIGIIFKGFVVYVDFEVKGLSKLILDLFSKPFH